MAAKSEGIRVQIYDQYYQLRSDSDEKYTRELAQSVDEVMRTIGEKTRSYDSLRLAVLAALRRDSAPIALPGLHQADQDRGDAGWRYCHRRGPRIGDRAHFVLLGAVRAVSRSGTWRHRMGAPVEIGVGTCGGSVGN